MSALAAAPAVRDLSGLSALVVDDDDFVRSVVQRQLASMGTGTVAGVSDGQAARQALEGRAYDLIVCDLMMPGTDGVELMRDIAGRQPDSAVILMSSSDPKVLSTAQKLAEGRQLHVLGTLQKPVRSAALRALVDGYVPKRERQSPVSRPQAAEVAEDAVRAALAGHEFTIAVQPQICLRTQRLVGVESLVRWPSPQLGAVAPDRFLGVIQRAGLIGELTDQVLGLTLAACGAWLREDLAARVSINFATSTLSDLGVPDRIVGMAHGHGVDPSRIVVEVTEGGLLDEGPNALEVMTRLRMRQVELSIDDFGTGYSSLDRLKSIPFNELKIDRGFVLACGRDLEALRIVASSIRLAHDLGLRVVAEGIEDAGTADLLYGLGCDIAQGFHYARPMAPADLPRWLAQRACGQCNGRADACPHRDACPVFRTRPVVHGERDMGPAANIPG